MSAYILRRLLWVFVLLFVVTLITFIVFSVLPAADPAVLRAGRQPTPELIAAKAAASTHHGMISASALPKMFSAS